jgi:magnesium transporter
MIDVTKRLTKLELASPIGSFTLPHELAFLSEETVGQVLNTLQSRKLSSDVAFFYVTDKDNVLQGIVTAYDLLYNPPEILLSDLVDNEIIVVKEDRPLEEGLKMMMLHHLISIPVVNVNNQFVGTLEIKIEKSASANANRKKIHKKHQQEDIFQLIGFSIEQGKTQSSLREYRYRMPWLVCNLVGGIICAFIGQYFQQTLVQFVVLALFIPLVLTLSEAISMQSMTLSLKFIHLKKIHWNHVWERIVIEWKTSLMLGLTCALCIGLFYLAWEIHMHAAIAIALSVLIAMFFSATFGALFPVLLHSFKRDPKVASGPLVLMMTDVATVTIYLGFGTLILI